MKRFLPLLFIAALALGGCASMSPKSYVDQTPAYDLRAFFDGPIRGWGLVQDRSGKVIGRFDVKMVGRWDGNDGVLEEEFFYYQGDVQSPRFRTWRFKDLGNGRYTGTAGDVAGVANNETYGTAGNWRYQMDLPLGKGTIRVNFDDWMWQMNDGVVMNRSYIRKFGVKVSEVTVFMQKVPAGEK
jgi:hypothetical protein